MALAQITEATQQPAIFRQRPCMSNYEWHIDDAARALRAGGVVAYPTEGVWGLGCDPGNEAAMQRVLDLKQREWRKGLILIASSWGQLAPWLAVAEEPAFCSEIWPGHTTCLIPAAAGTSSLLRGEHDTLAVRISAHPPVRALCEAFAGALVSTSANRAGQPTPLDLDGLRAEFGEDIDVYLDAPLGKAQAPSRIMDPYSGQTYRS